ncbi:MAG: tRNA (adenosine(37)-N6)-threonylcarbamoyltransferase complex transferase subunit TsaD [Candidatus Magasanikbacteria bacterium]|nr:tRNA (adenosine(37)-N6)-threonylcarbamoyltransferase complex transferase subunit TsaD [Candidatus Magasanikbacteria bacterium]
MLILGIESSCDDTSIALLDCSDKGHFVLSEKTASQIDVHKKYGGVVPEIAGRMHAEKIVPLIEAVLENQPKPDVIAATSGPGLITGLLVGTEAARTLSYVSGIPLIATNHIEGHIYSTQINTNQHNNPHIQFPALCLIVSGGHTELILMKDHGTYQLLGATKDDAAGECFDKGAKLIDLPYPGGPQISKLALSGNTKAIHFPRPMLDSSDYNFSFSGLKTSALYWLRDNKNESFNSNDFCASFEQAIIDVLVTKTMAAAAEYKPNTIILGGGVSANKKLRETLQEEIGKQFPHTSFQIPELKYAMDNGAMIAVAGYYHALKKDFTSWDNIKANPNWRLAK